MSDDASSAAIPAGWYDDGTGRQRWWDGTAWTDPYAATVDPASQIAEHHFDEMRADEPDASSAELEHEDHPASGNDEGSNVGDSGSLEIHNRGERIALNRDSLTFTFEGASIQRVKKAVSPRRIPLIDVESIDYVAPTAWRTGLLRVAIIGDTAPIKGPQFDINSVQIPAGRGDKLKKQWDEFAESLENAVQDSKGNERFEPIEFSKADDSHGGSANTGELDKREKRRIERTAAADQRAAANDARKARQTAIDDVFNERVGRLVVHQPGAQLYVYEKEVWRGKPGAVGAVGGSMAGARAEVVTQGQLTQRVTATRLVTLGVFALAAPKKTGNQQVHLHVVTPKFEFVYSPFGDPNSTTIKFLNHAAEVINNRAIALASQGPQAASNLPGASMADELRKYSQLHAEGILTDEEFASMKAKLLRM